MPVWPIATTGGGGTASAFSVPVDGTAHAAGTSANPKAGDFFVPGDREYYTSDVTGIASFGAPTTIGVPAGLWTFTLSGQVGVGTNPTSGDFLLGFNSSEGESAACRIPWQAFNVNADDKASFVWTRDIYYVASGTVEMWIANNLNQSAFVQYGYFTGVRSSLPAGPGVPV